MDKSIKHILYREFRRILCQLHLIDEIYNYDYDYSFWILTKEPSKKELLRQKTQEFNINPKISLITPVWNTPKQFLIDMIESVRQQTYSNWELCIADGASAKYYVKEILEKYTKIDTRIKVKFLNENKGIALNSNEALSLSTGDFITFLDHDDTIAPFALFEIVKAVNENPDADFIYSDEDKISKNNKKRFSPHFKPDYAPDTLRSYNYIYHLFVVKKELLNSIGGFRENFDGSQDYDLILRCAEKAKKTLHIPKILYHWRAHKDSTASNSNAKLYAKPYAYEVAKKAIQSHLDRLNLKASVKKDGMFLGVYKTTYEITDTPKISIIIPNQDHTEDLQKCIDSIINKSTYKNYEIIIVENNSKQKEVFDYYNKIENEYKNITILKWHNEFNYSAINNFASGYAKGNILLFLNNDIQVISENWLEEMLMFTQRKDVGITGAKLYFSDNTIQHAGIIIRSNISPAEIGHSHKSKKETKGYFGRLLIAQNLSAVTGACQMMRKEVFDEINGFDEEYTVAYSDVDICIKTRAKGYLIVWTPYAELYHYTRQTRGKDNTPEKKQRDRKDLDLFRKKWADIFKKGDPYCNPNLELKRDEFLIKA